MTFFICHDPEVRSTCITYLVINLDDIVLADYTPSAGSQFGKPFFELKIKTPEGLKNIIILGEDAARLLGAMNLYEPPPPPKGTYPQENTKSAKIRKKM